MDYGKGLRMRWINCACYEIVLPDGTAVVVDPYITAAIDGQTFSVEQIEKCDYILVTHTHGDHLTDVEYLMKKFDSRLIIGSVSAPLFLTATDIDYSRVYCVSPGDVMHFDDAEFRVSRARHCMPSNREKARFSNKASSEERWKEHGYNFGGDTLLAGSIELMDYLITAKNGVRLLIASGDVSLNNSVVITDSEHPDVVIRQTNGKTTPRQYAEMLAKYNCPILFPHHHEKVHKDCGGYAGSRDDYMEETKGFLASLNPLSTFINPTQFRWYRVRLSVEEEQ